MYVLFADRRHFYLDGNHLEVKEMRSPPYARTSFYIQIRLSNAILMQLVAPNSQVEKDDMITVIDDECTPHKHINTSHP